VEIKRNYAFVEFKELDDAIDAQKKTHGTNFDGRTITVEFVESSRLGKDRWARGLKYRRTGNSSWGRLWLECTVEASNNMHRGSRCLPQRFKLCCHSAAVSKG